ncbi:MAG: hypothetical protein LBQ79_10295 [Deltaproteobacteria bacterium]|jgi:hypothetical protein|nr:hypothetical protein [Deltaproteobacteria bacterium]
MSEAGTTAADGRKTVGGASGGRGKVRSGTSSGTGSRPLSAARRAAEAKQREQLSLLEKFARGLGLKVSSGNLLFAGLRLKSGQCVYREEPWLVLDRTQPFEDQLELFRKAFEDLDVPSFTDEVKSLLYPDGLGLLEHARDAAASDLEAASAEGEGGGPAGDPEESGAPASGTGTFPEGGAAVSAGVLSGSVSAASSADAGLSRGAREFSGGTAGTD